MLMSLADKQCVPCRGGVPPLEPAKVEELLGQLEQGWALNADGHIERQYEFKDFAEALAFVNAVGAIAETRRPPSRPVPGVGPLQSGNLDA